MVIITYVDVCDHLTALREANAIKTENEVPREDNLLSSPYSDNSVAEIAMRRKAHILQYSPSSQSSQTNSTTSTQNYSRLMTNRRLGSYNASQVKSTTSRTTTLNEQCANLSDVKMPMPASRSGVPGNMNLYNDTSIRLYSFGNHMLRR